METETKAAADWPQDQTFRPTIPVSSAENPGWVYNDLKSIFRA